MLRGILFPHPTSKENFIYVPKLLFFYPSQLICTHNICMDVQYHNIIRPNYHSSIKLKFNQLFLLSSTETIYKLGHKEQPQAIVGVGTGSYRQIFNKLVHDREFVVVVGSNEKHEFVFHVGIVR